MTLSRRHGRDRDASPPCRAASLIGFHRRLKGQRLDLIASRYLADPTAFWRLCDANNALAPTRWPRTT